MKVLDKQTIDDLLSIDSSGCLIRFEDSSIEYKEDFNKSNKAKYLKVIASFYNTEGGHLIFGINDNREVVGLPDGFIEPDIADISNEFKTYFSPSAKISGSKEEVNGKVVFILQIAKRESIPTVCIKNLGDLKPATIYHRYSGQSEPIKAYDLINLLHNLTKEGNGKMAEIADKELKAKYRVKLFTSAGCRSQNSTINLAIKNMGHSCTIHEMIISDEVIFHNCKTPFFLDTYQPAKDSGAKYLQGHTSDGRLSHSITFQIEFIYSDEVKNFYKHVVPFSGAFGNYEKFMPEELHDYAPPVME